MDHRRRVQCRQLREHQTADLRYRLPSATASLTSLFQWPVLRRLGELAGLRLQCIQALQCGTEGRISCRCSRGKLGESGGAWPVEKLCDSWQIN
jgi:hypothetical protein